MAVYDLEEQEQLEEIKTWWKQHGNLVTTVITVIALALAAWQGWNWWQRKQATEASAIYMALEQSIGAQDAKKTRELAGMLIEKYPRTTYAAMGALLSARVQTEFGDAKTAHVELQWVAEHGKDAVVRDLARLRLAALLLDEKSYDEALKQLAAPPQAGLAARFAELKGDVLAVQGKKAEAAASYTAALAALDQTPKGNGPDVHASYRDMLQAKLDSLGVAK
ncbi:putative membrane protein [Georgfuchsia toluolica]|uniref:Membrane protein n=1 Tax=Georgfuchsia toluolica TaxID=424218 RepID=A0A916J3Q7_9PROT|nr:tetratricopeptide repeat protein [Georgfuchsia toluolica]CAG4883428.1 putative membrane protein [Georgfuchsia toluolica]